MKAKIIALSILIAVVLVWLPVQVFAHGEPKISVAPDLVAPGGKITVKGETMGANEDFKISLEGLNFHADLGTASSGADENLSAEFTIPANAPVGDYQIKALSDDGDSATADCTVAASNNNATTDQSAGDAAEAMPSAAPHELPHPRTPFETAGLAGAVLLSTALGLVLVRRK